MHSLCAYMVYKDIIPRDTPIKDIKKLYPHQRKAVKPIEFSQQFGGSEFAIQGAMGCTLEEAKAFKYAYTSLILHLLSDIISSLVTRRIL